VRIVDLREYKPASVLVVDLVKHSTRSKDVVYEIQQNLEDVFNSVRGILGLAETHFNYTGDGYVCALAGEASSRAIDFLNAAIPRLQDKLRPYGQEIRIGVDFGLIHLRDNVLTTKAEFFDSPSIVAARLEHSAKPGQTLCSQRFRDIFKDYCPEVFSQESITIQTKDRELIAYQIQPVPFAEVSSLIKAYLLGAGDRALEILDGRKEIFLIDDEVTIVEIISSMIQSAYPNAAVRTYASGAAALRDATPGRVGVACVDLMMAGLDGIGTMERMLAIDSGIVVFVVTAVHDDSVAETAMNNGAAYFLRKPFERQDLISLLDSCDTISRLHQSVRFMAQNRGRFMWNLQRIRELRYSILKRLGPRDDRVAQMIRHRLKNSVTECALSISTTSDCPRKTAQILCDLKCLDRLSCGLAPVGSQNLCDSLRSVVTDIQRIYSSAKLQLECDIQVNNDRLTSEIPTLVLVVSELLQNAVDATKERGKIRVSIGSLPSRSAIQIVVKDDGPGIPKRLRDKVFQSGVSTKGEGRGLGLALVSNAVKSIGGEMTYSYERGSAFRVIFPLV